jgi:hypothetical protein
MGQIDKSFDIPVGTAQMQHIVISTNWQGYSIRQG